MKKLFLSAALLLGASLSGWADESPGYLDLNGTDRYMLIPNSEDFNIAAGGSITVSLDVKLNKQGTQRFIANRVRDYSGGNNGNVSGFEMYSNLTTNTSVSFNYPGTGWNARHNDAGFHISTGEWHHLCWVYSGSSAVFYIDGVAKNTNTNLVNSAIPSLADILVGAGYVMADNTSFSLDNLSSFTDGQIDDVRIYSEAFSGADVSDDMNSEAPLAGKTLIAAYDFAEIDGTKVADISGNGHDAELKGTWPVYEIPKEPGVESPGYLELDGVSRYMLIPNNEAFNIAAGGKFTVALDVMLEQTAIQRMVCNRVRDYSGGNNNNVSGFEIYTVSNNTSVSFNYPGSGWTARHNNAGYHISANVWHHMCWVYDGSTAKLYIDGYEAGTSATANNADIPSLADMLVGAGYVMADNTTFSLDNLSSFTKGKIDNLRFYADALTAAEVAQDNSSEEAPLADKNVIAAYNFDAYTGTTVPDITGNGHDGQLKGDWPVVGAKYPVNVTCNEAGGTVAVTANGQVVESGSEVEMGTEITITATPNANFIVKQIKVNGNVIATAENVATYTVAGTTNIEVVFEYLDAAVTKIPVFMMNENGSKYYRIPALVKAADGSLVAIADRRGDKLNDLPNTISVVAKRSTNNGATWSDMVTIAEGNASLGTTYGDPAVVLDRETGALICMYSGDQGFWNSTKTDRAGFYVSFSYDNGVNWTAPKSITDEVYQSNWYGAFVASGRGVQLSSGRICFVANAHVSPTVEQGINEYMIYSDDHGATWQVSTSNAVDGFRGNESKIVELTNGDLLMSIRNYEGGKRRFSKSTDQGMNWSAPYTLDDFKDPSCNGDIIRFPSADGVSRILHSIPYSNIRENLSVLMSYDEGQTWPVRKTLIEGYSAYSSLEVLDDGTICCLVEEGKWDGNLPGEDGFDLYLMKFSLEWLTDGADSYNPTAANKLNYTVGEGGAVEIWSQRDENNLPAGAQVFNNAPIPNLGENGELAIYVTPEVGNVVKSISFVCGENAIDADYQGTVQYGEAIAKLYTIAASEITASLAINVEFASKAEGPEYCQPTGVAGRYNEDNKTTYDGRYLSQITVTDGTNSATVEGSATTATRAVVYDRTSTILTTEAGKTLSFASTGAGEWMNTFVYIDWNLDGFSVGDRVFSNFTGGSNSYAERFDVTVPDYVVPGDYRVRYILDWENLNPCEYGQASEGGNKTNDNGEVVVDFVIRVQYAPRAISVVSSDETMGTVAITNPATEGNSVTTPQEEVTVVATALEGYEFVNWTVEGEEVSTEATYVYSGAEAVTLTANFQVYTIDYCEPQPAEGRTVGANITNRTDRGVVSIVLSDGIGSATVEGPGYASGRAVVYDRTETVFTTTAGSTVSVNINGKGEWMNTFLFIDFNKDGFAANDLIHSNYQGQEPAPHNYIATSFNIQIPATVAAGDYRVRYVLDWWNQSNPCMYGQNGGDNGEAVVDFTIRIASDEYENARVITVVADDDTRGTVAIIDPATEGNQVTTAQKAVTVEATAAEGYAFINWTNAAGEEVSTETTYVYTGTEDVTLTANFGYTLSYFVGEGGTAAFMVDGQAVNSDVVLAPETEVTINVTPATDMQASIIVNGTAVSFTNNTYSFVMTSSTSVVVSFVDAVYTLTIEVEGDGEVKVTDTGDYRTGPSGNEYTNDSEITGLALKGFVKPAEGAQLVYIGYEDEGNDATDLTSKVREVTAEGFEGWYFVALPKAKGNRVFTVEFTEVSAIGELGIDPANGPVEYYNLQGVRVEAENLVPGFYVVRQGDKVAKVLIKK